MSQQGRLAHLTHKGVLGAFIVAERKQQGAASDLFKLAKRCKDQVEFIRRCEEAEDFYLSDEAGQMKIKELPRKYIQAKSDIKGGFKAGLDFTRIKSYHAMKNAKGEANKQAAAPEESEVVVVVPDQDEAAPTISDEVVTVQSTKEQRDSTRRYAGPRKDRDASPEITMAEALEQGLVLDAKTNVLMPEDMRALVVALSKLPEMPRARLIKQFTKDAQRALSEQGQRPQSGVIHVQSA